MLKIVAFVAAIAAVSVAATAPAQAEGGCYRIGETGYHYYNFCLGPWFLYRQGDARAEGSDYAPVAGRHHYRRHHRRHY